MRPVRIPTLSPEQLGVYGAKIGNILSTQGEAHGEKKRINRRLRYIDESCSAALVPCANRGRSVS